MSDELHIRTIRVGAARVGPAELEVTGRLVDERPQLGGWFGINQGRIIHDMTLTIRVRHPDLVITAATGTMDSHPYTLCPEALPPLAGLVGLSVARGFTRAVNERFGRERGCSHLTALIQAMAPVVKQGVGPAFHDERELPRAQDDMWFVNSCHAWRADGELHRHLKAGDVDGLRRLSARRPPE